MADLPRVRGEAAAFEPVVVENRGGASRFIVICDHAANFVPPEYDALGLSPAALDMHIAWDPGALGVARKLAADLGAALVRATVSRLVLDCNRPLDAPDLIATTSETTTIPGNADISGAERDRRIADVHVPYHAAIERLVAERLAARREPALVAVHSFTPVYRGVARPWQIGVLFDRDRELADPLIARLKGEGLKVGINEPYSPADRVYYTMTRHGDARGLHTVMIEIRNDLIVNETQQHEWAARLARMIGPHGADTRAA